MPVLSVAAQEEAGQPEIPDAVSLLDTLATAGRQLDYRGVFTYEYSGMLKSVEVIHIARDGVEHERLFYLNGPQLEILRQSPFCGEDNASLERVTRPMVNQARMAGYYDVQLWGEDRIAGRPVWVLHLAPSDTHRYGFVFSVDKDSGLLLQSLLLDANHRVLERFQYLLVDYGIDSDTAEELVIATREDGEGQHSSDDSCGAAVLADGGSNWQTEWLPPGFLLMSRTQGDGDIESLLFSDGLAVFSVFFDPDGSQRLPEVQAQRGATVAQLARIEAGGTEYLVSVVGEIPLETAQRVAGFVRYGVERQQ